MAKEKTREREGGRETEREGEKKREGGEKQRKRKRIRERNRERERESKAERQSLGNIYSSVWHSIYEKKKWNERKKVNIYKRGRLWAAVGAQGN